MTSNDQSRVAKDTSSRKHPKRDNESRTVPALKVAAMKAAQETYIETITNGFEKQIQDSEAEHGEEMAALQAEHAQTIADLETKHVQAIAELRTEHERAAAQSKSRHDRTIGYLKGAREEEYRTTLARLGEVHKEDLKQAVLEERKEQEVKIANLGDQLKALQQEKQSRETTFTPEAIRKTMREKQQQMAAKFKVPNAAEE